MPRLSSYSKSPIFTIAINYNGELVKFNLARELKIDTSDLTGDLSNQPKYYGFVLLLHKGLLTKWEDAKMRRKRIYGRLFIQAKGRKINNRQMSDDVSKCWVESHKQFIAITSECIKAKDEADRIYSCIRAFEQRKDLMQSISSNLRAEKF